MSVLGRLQCNLYFEEKNMTTIVVFDFFASKNIKVDITAL